MRCADLDARAVDNEMYRRIDRCEAPCDIEVLTTPREAVLVAQSENFLGPPRLSDGDGPQAAITSEESHSVTSPRCMSARSYFASRTRPVSSGQGAGAVPGKERGLRQGFTAWNDPLLRTPTRTEAMSI
jgi:hypothetical protein